MLEQLILALIFIAVVLAAAASFHNPYKYKKVIYYLRSRIAPQAKITNLGFQFVYDSFPIELKLSGGGKFPQSLTAVLTGKFPKQKMFMYDYPLVADEVRWAKSKLTTIFEETELKSEDTLYDSVSARLKIMVNVARELEAKN